MHRNPFNLPPAVPMRCASNRDITHEVTRTTIPLLYQLVILVPDYEFIGDVLPFRSPTLIPNKLISKEATLWLRK